MSSSGPGFGTFWLWGLGLLSVGWMDISKSKTGATLSEKSWSPSSHSQACVLGLGHCHQGYHFPTWPFLCSEEAKGPLWHSTLCTLLAEGALGVGSSGFGEL